MLRRGTQRTLSSAGRKEAGRGRRSTRICCSAMDRRRRRIAPKRAGECSICTDRSPSPGAARWPSLRASPDSVQPCSARPSHRPFHRPAYRTVRRTVFRLLPPSARGRGIAPLGATGGFRQSILARENQPPETRPGARPHHANTAASSIPQRLHRTPGRARRAERRAGTRPRLVRRPGRLRDLHP